ncbi:hypothetical protein M378DRAFT_158698 [Amanita muscaria Koide BX008]|uniref:Uncharacterized protein n=1 Tax=Amanita muscaria (strain Koide BX008) TaxID=946122 RepID=A0A0C2TLZ6_AMAMK|nr:hypothetical protein M378DRAFT_158698 [Amanita muscaria Koide BX008]
MGCQGCRQGQFRAIDKHKWKANIGKVGMRGDEFGLLTDGSAHVTSGERTVRTGFSKFSAAEGIYEPPGNNCLWRRRKGTSLLKSMKEKGNKEADD